MKFFVNNNTTYNYSYYATRPRWLVEAFPKVLLPQKEFKAGFLYSKKSFITHNIAFASSANHTKADQKLKNQGAFPAKESFFTQTHLKKDFLKKKASAFLKQTQTKNRNNILQQLESSEVALKTHSKVIKASTKKLSRYLFQTKELLCWTSDLSFFNLRGYFSNILKVLQICRFAVRNNKKILFIKGSSSSNGQEKLLSPRLLQYERNTVPLILNNLLSKSYFPTRPLLFPQIFWFKKSKTNPDKAKDPHKITNVIGHPESLKRASKKSQIVKNTSASFESELKKNQRDNYFSRLQEDNSAEKTQKNVTTPQNTCYFQLSGLSNNTRFRRNQNYKSAYFIHFGKQTPLSISQKSPVKSSSIWSESESLGAGQQKKACFLKKHSYIKEQNYPLEERYLGNSNPRKQSLNLIKIKTAQQRVKLWLKEAQIISQQTAAGLTIPLTGFLTNSKTTFNTIYNLSNNDFYNFVNSKLKSNDLVDQSINQIKINRLEKAYFQKHNHLLPLAKKQDKFLGELPNLLGKKKKILRRKTIKDIYSKFKSEKQESGDSFRNLKYPVSQGQPRKKPANNGKVKGFAFPNIFETETVIREIKKSKNKGFIQRFLKKTIDVALKPKDQKKQHNFVLRGCWIVHSNTHNYLSFESNTLGLLKNSKLINYNEKIKKSKPLEYCFFGDIFTWQSKSHKSYSMYYFNTLFDKNKDNIISYLKKRAIPEKRRPLVNKKKKSSFFTRFKKQLNSFRGFNSRKPVQTKETFLKKRQLLSTLAKFIVFYFYNSHKKVKNLIKRENQNRTYIELPSFLFIKSTIKIAAHSGFKNKYSRRPTYGYNLGLGISEHTYNYRQNKTKALQLKPLSVKVKENKEGKSVFSRKIVPFFTQRHLINETLPQKKRRLRSLIFYKYYKAIIGLNHFNQYKMFAKTPFLNNQLADVIFFINPEKNRRLVNQANSLRIPTVGITSGNMTSTQGHQGYNDFRLKKSVYYPIIGNPTSSFFTRAIINLIVKYLRVEKFNN